MRYFMIDRIVDYSPGNSAVAIKNVTLSDEILHDHFPDFPVLPGALLVEAMAQLGGFLIEMSLNTPERIRRAILAQIERAKFYRTAEPGDQIQIQATLAEHMDDAVKINFRADIAGQKTAVATLTFVLRTIDSVKIHDQRKYVYRLWTKHFDQELTIL